MIFQPFLLRNAPPFQNETRPQSKSRGQFTFFVRYLGQKFEEECGIPFFILVPRIALEFLLRPPCC